MTKRSPASVAILGLITLVIYAIIWYASTREELVARGADIPPIIHLFIPILNLIWLLKYGQGVQKVTNGATSAGTAFMLLLFLGPIGAAVLQSKYNEIA